MSLFFNRPKHRVFDYRPHYYKPASEKGIKIPRLTSMGRRRKAPWMLIIFLAALFMLFFYLRGGIFTNRHDKIAVGSGDVIIVENSGNENASGKTN